MTVNTPFFIYGTAWKEEATESLMLKAHGAGFRAFDTANQKKHYREDYAGNAMEKLFSQGVKREDLFLQSKYTYQHGQDHRLPYNPDDDFKTQVKSSFAGTLKNLHTEYMDSFLLHGPLSQRAMHDADWEVWSAMEDLFQEGKTKSIGVSNVQFRHIAELLQKAKVKPKFVQNRCYAQLGWDKLVREFCNSNNIIYQGFSLLTANVFVLQDERVAQIANSLKVTPQQVIFRFSKQIGILPLTGTTSEKHMADDLRIDEFELSNHDIDNIMNLSVRE